MGTGIYVPRLTTAGGLTADNEQIGLGIEMRHIPA
jgi:hypothetical protein